MCVLDEDEDFGEDEEELVSASQLFGNAGQSRTSDQYCF